MRRVEQRRRKGKKANEGIRSEDETPLAAYLSLKGKEKDSSWLRREARDEIHSQKE